jgi:8-oxo-dGTP pyrophosphatase MutT (NUDIX family)
MGMLPGQIRVLTLAIIKKDGKVLAQKGHDKIKNEDFFRLLGGGVDFGENSLDALKRELKEELDAEIINCKLVKVLENIFIFNGNQGHEICFVYEADFANQNNYQRENFSILDSRGYVAEWVELNEKNIKNIFPSGCI